MVEDHVSFIDLSFFKQVVILTMTKSQVKGSGHRPSVLKTNSEASKNPEQFALFMEATATYVGTTFQEAADLDTLLTNPIKDKTFRRC